MYLEMAEEEDKKLAEHWQANADGILIFVRLYPLIPYFMSSYRSKTGLFSAAVASLISVSIQDIRPSSQDTSNFYLANIYQTLADPDRSNVSHSLPSPPPFSPPNYAIWVNALWFLSLVTGISCALLATLLQQWARRYLKVTQPHCSIAKRARIRAFFAEGVEKFVLLWVAESLPTLLHTSLFLFLAGLVVFLQNVNFTVFKLTLAWIGFCAALYGCATFPPMICHDCPYYTPFTIFFWQVALGILDIFYQVRSSFGSSRRREALGKLRDRYHKWNMQGIHKTAEETALLPSLSWLDTRAFMWTFDSLAEDRELERFFSGLPGFRRSREVVVDPLLSLTSQQKQKFSDALKWLLKVTFSTHLLSDSVKKQRAIVCAKAVDPAHIPDAFGVLHTILSEYQYSFPLATADIVHSVKGWGDSTDECAVLDAQAAISTIIARVQPRDDSWFMLASDTLGIPESVLRGYAANDDNLSLAILIHMTRQQFSNHGNPSWPSVKFSEILDAASRFNVQGTSPQLQNDFCALWNQIVFKVQNEDDQSMAFDILGPIRNIYIALHHSTDSVLTRLSPSTGDKADILTEPSSYPGCNVTGHIHGGFTSTVFSRAILHDNAALTPDPVTARVMQGGIDTTITIPLPTPESSVSVSPPTPMVSIPTPPPGAAAVQRITDRCTSPDVQGVPSLPSPASVLYNMHPTGPQSSLDSSVAGSNHASSLLEPHSSLLGPATPGTSLPRLSSQPDPGVAIEGEGSAKAALHERNALEPPSTIREITMAAPDLPSQSPSPPAVTNVTSAGPSRRSLGAEHTGDQPLHPSHGLYDIV